jgi:hypothetical protein
MTVVQAGMNAQKANSAIQAWALGLKDALEQAFVFTALWLGEKTSPSVRCSPTSTSARPTTRAPRS